MHDEVLRRRGGRVDILIESGGHVCRYLRGVRVRRRVDGRDACQQNPRLKRFREEPTKGAAAPLLLP